MHSSAPYRLFQLISPSLPIGGFTYSQGLEWAVEAGWVKNQAQLTQWLECMLNYSLSTLELPIMAQFYQAIDENDEGRIRQWSEYLYASRETKELRLEELQRGRAMFVLGKQLLPESFEQFQPTHSDDPIQNQLLGFAIAAHAWGISLQDLQQGYVWSWAENLVTAGVKLVPLGQSAGQKVLIEVSDLMPQALIHAQQIQPEQIASFTPAMAMASSCHETQYTRLFRS